MNQFLFNFFSLSLLFCSTFLLGAAESERQKPHVELLIKIPTRERAENFFAALDKYYDLLSGKHSYHFVISCDKNDPVMNSKKNIDKLKTYPHLSVFFNNNKNKVQAYNRNIKDYPNFDVVLVGSDDQIPVVEGYDAIILSTMKRYFPDLDGVLHFNDGIMGYRLNTQVIAGKKYYDRFGYIYHPSYISLYCDNEFTDISRMLNKAIYSDQMIIKHEHPCLGKINPDALYFKNDSFSSKDEKTYHFRKSKNFGFPSNADK